MRGYGRWSRRCASHDARVGCRGERQERPARERPPKEGRARRRARAGVLMGRRPAPTLDHGATIMTDRTATLTFSDGASAVTLPVLSGSIGPDVIDIRTLYGKTGRFTYDPGFLSTAS